MENLKCVQFAHRKKKNVNQTSFSIDFALSFHHLYFILKNVRVLSLFSETYLHLKVILEMFSIIL